MHIYIYIHSYIRTCTYNAYAYTYTYISTHIDILQRTKMCCQLRELEKLSAAFGEDGD